MYIKPLVEVWQDFEAVPNGVTEPLAAFIVGPNFQLVRYSVVTEKNTGLLGAYIPGTNTSYYWPGRETGAVVDPDYTRLFIENASMQYFTSAAVGGASITAPFCGSPTTRGKNEIEADGINWVTSGSYARSALLKQRDVQIGDQIQVSGVVNGEVVTHATYVSGFRAEDVNPTGLVGSVIPDAENASARASVSVTVSQVTGTPVNDVTLLAENVDGTAYNGLGTRTPVETYTLEVVTPGNPWDALNLPVLRVMSTSGMDDVAATPVEADTFIDIGTLGLRVKFTEANTYSSSSLIDGVDAFWMALGQKWTVTVKQIYAIPGVTAGSTYMGASDTTYTVRVTKGGTFAEAPQIVVSTTTGVDSGGPYTVTSGGTLAIGSFETTLRFTGAGLCLNDRWSVPVIAKSAGAVTGLILGRNLPAGLLGVDDSGHCGFAPALTAVLCIQKNAEILAESAGFAPLLNFTQNAVQICVNENIMGYDSTWIDDQGTLLPMPILSGTLYVQYRAYLQTYTSAIQSAATSEDAAGLGVIDPDNPLAFGVSKAQANANGTQVMFCAVADNTLESWQKVLNLASQRDGVYGFVPLTFDRSVQQAFAAHVASLSSPTTGRWRKLFTSCQVLEVQQVVGAVAGSPLLATITADPLAPSQNTFVEVSLSGTQQAFSFVKAGVRNGDTLRYAFQSDGFGNWTWSEALIDAVLTDDSVRLMTGSQLQITVASKIEIWRTLTASDMASAVAAASGAFSNRRVHNIYPDAIEVSGVSVPGYYAAAAVAGLRAGSAPNQPLTKVELAGFDSVKKITQVFSSDQLDTMAARGTWIITQDATTGTIYTRDALTTDQTDYKHGDEMVTANWDSISYVCLSAMAPFIGRSNVTQSNLAQLRAELTSVLTQLSNTVTQTLGPQILSFTIASIEQSPIAADRVVAVVNLILPAPLNNLELHLVV